MDEDKLTRPRLPLPPPRVVPSTDSAHSTVRTAARAAPTIESILSASASSSRSETSSVTRDPRTQLESGLVLWARLNALIVFGITILVVALHMLTRDTAFDRPPPWVQLGLGLLFVAAGFGLGPLRLNRRQLELADIVLPATAGVGFAWMVSTLPDAPPEARHLVFEVTAAHVLMLRAGVVPSSGARTAWVGLAAVSPGLLFYMTGYMSDVVPPLTAGLQMAIRCSATVVASALASRRIYGLRKQVAQSRQLGQYTLQEKVGTGGMGVVFKASHALLRRPTAIKLLLPDEVGESTLAQFEREAQLTSQLTHPSTIQIFDFGRNDSGVFYYAMEYLEGLTLYELVALTGKQGPSRTITLLVQVCGSLAEAHGVGLVHRDIKPANLMVCERGRVADVVKVLDFGLAKMRGQPSQTLSGLSGTIAGTPGFMSPESIMHPESVDARSDIYAVGAVAYYLLTGQELFGERPVSEVLLDQVNTDPVPIRVRRGAPIPLDLEHVIMSCLAKDPRQRPQSADELSERLLACSAAGAWSPARARAWWEAHRDLIQHRVRERTSSIQGSFAARPRGKKARRQGPSSA